jgi:hypothetical protein
MSDAAVLRFTVIEKNVGGLHQLIAQLPAEIDERTHGGNSGPVIAH